MVVAPRDAQQSASSPQLSGAAICLRVPVTESTAYQVCAARVHLDTLLSTHRLLT